MLLVAMYQKGIVCRSAHLDFIPFRLNEAAVFPNITSGLTYAARSIDRNVARGEYKGDTSPCTYLSVSQD